MAKSTKSASNSSIVATLPADLKSVTKPVVKDALRAAARILGGAWGFVEKSENDTVYTIRREADGAALTAKRIPGSPVTLTGAAPVEVKPKAEPKAKAKAEAKPVEPPKADKPKAGKAKADAPKAKAKPVEGKGAVVAPVVKGKATAAKADAKPVVMTPAEKAHAEVVPF